MKSNTRKWLTILVVFLPSLFVIAWSLVDLFTKDPFNHYVQVRTLEKVAQIMRVELKSNIQPPTVLRAEKVSNEYNNSVWGFDVGNKRSNIFDPKTKTILLTKDAEIHNLAHEMTHYIQFNYLGLTGEDGTSELMEWEAIWVQNHFR